MPTIPYLPVIVKTLSESVLACQNMLYKIIIMMKVTVVGE